MLFQKLIKTDIYMTNTNTIIKSKEQKLCDIGDIPYGLNK